MKVKDPTGCFVLANGLRHKCHVWDGGGDTTLLFLHGFLDVGLSWSWVIEALSDPSYHCVALDWRGHGESDWIGPGGYYHFPDYCRDLHRLVPQITREKCIVVAHSMGAMAATLWMGTQPQGIDGLVLVEAVGPMASGERDYSQRLGQWLEETSPFDPERFNNPMQDLEHAAKRLSRIYSRVSEDRVKQIAKFATIEDGNGGLRWRYDPLHRTRSPLPYPEHAAGHLWRRIQCPLLWVGGSASLLSGPRLEQWLSQRPNLNRAVIENAGHMLHTEAPKSLASLIESFILRSVSA